MTFKQYLAIIIFKTQTELKNERQRTYLGFIWWILEPLMFLAIFYAVFIHIRQNSTENFVQFLLIGLILWQWFKSSISQSSPVIIYQINLLRQVRIDAWIFPVIKVAANTVKFIIVFSLLIVFLWATGFTPNLNYLYMIEVILILFLLINGVVLCLAAIVPFIPDINVIVDNLLLGLFFVTGIFFPIDMIPEPIHSYLSLNPMLRIIENSREILINSQPPNQADMLYVFVMAIVFIFIGLFLFKRFQNHYAKLSES
ncbi:MAG: ABC transporter permease [Marinicellaceae bacterium]